MVKLLPFLVYSVVPAGVAFASLAVCHCRQAVNRSRATATSITIIHSGHTASDFVEQISTVLQYKVGQ